MGAILYRFSLKHIEAIKLQFRFATFPFYMRIVTTNVSTILLETKTHRGSHQVSIKLQFRFIH